MTNIDTRWEQALLNKVTSNGERIAVIERDVKEIKDNSIRTNESISALQGIMSNLDKRLSTVEGNLSSVDNRLSTVETKLSDVDIRLSSIEKLIHDAKKLMKWLLGGMGAVFLSLVANFIYTFLH